MIDKMEILELKHKIIKIEFDYRGLPADCRSEKKSMNMKFEH